MRAQALPELAATEPAAPNAAASRLLASGVIVGGTPDGDAIVVSQRALALLRAGLAVRAFVIAGLESLRRTISLGGSARLRLRHGIYQLV